MSLRVLLYSVTYPGEAGGVQRIVMRLGERLRQRGHDVRTAWAAPNPNPLAVDAIYSLPRLARWHGIPTPRSLYKSLRSLVHLARALRRTRPQVVNIHFVTAAARYFVRLRPLLGYRIVLSVHGSDVMRPQPWDEPMLPRLLPKADAITVVSNVTAERVRQIPGVDPARVHLIPNGIDAAFWGAPIGALPVAERGPIVLAVGRMMPVKGQDVLLRAFAEVATRRPGARLVLVGDGPARTEFAALASSLGLDSHVEFTGQLDAEAVRARMGMARLLVLPSRSEGLPLALLEAMAAGLPVVATQVGGVPDVVTPDTGHLVPPEDPPALAAAILTLLDDTERLTHMSHHAHRHAQTYSASAADAAYELLFRSLCTSQDEFTAKTQRPQRRLTTTAEPPRHPRL